MRFTLSAIVAAALAVSAVAVDIVLYPNSDVCNDNSGGLECSNIGPNTCCHLGGRDFFSAKCASLLTEGIPDICVIAVGPVASLCGTNCNAGSGSNIICLDPGSCPAATGAYYIRIPGKIESGSTVVNTTCQQSVEPDRAFFTNGQKFRINYDVPEDVTALLINLVKTDPHLSKGAPEAILPYEIKEEEKA